MPKNYFCGNQSTGPLCQGNQLSAPRTHIHMQNLSRQMSFALCSESQQTGEQEKKVRGTSQNFLPLGSFFWAWIPEPHSSAELPWIDKTSAHMPVRLKNVRCSIVKTSSANLSQQNLFPQRIVLLPFKLAVIHFFFFFFLGTYPKGDAVLNGLTNSLSHWPPWR